MDSRWNITTARWNVRKLGWNTLNKKDDQNNQRGKKKLDRWLVGDLDVMFFINNVTDKIGVRNMSSDDETQGFLRSVTPTLPRMGGISITKRFGG